MDSRKIEKPTNYVLSSYRPYTKKWLAYDSNIVEMPGRYKNIFGENNKIIYCTGKGASRDFSAIVTDCIPNLDLMEKGQGFYFINNTESNSLFEKSSNISEKIINKLKISEDEVFSYVYGMLHSLEYRNKYSNELRKDLPRIPIVSNYREFILIGEQLIDLHINYEEIAPLDEISLIMSDAPSYQVKKMKYLSRNDKSTIIYNSDIKITNIPEKAYEYIVNGKPAIQWIMEQYSVPNKTNSGNIDDPNTYSAEQTYVLDLLLSVISLSVKTVDLVKALPTLEIIE